MTTMTSAITAADNHVDAKVDRRLAGLLERTVARRGIHHANVAIAGTDGRRWAGAAGDAGPDGTSLTPDTPFYIASVTKRFIITLVLQAHERGELDLDEPITAHLPGEVTHGLHVLRGVDHTGEITLRHLASHTSGLPDYFDKPRHGPSLYQRLAAGHDHDWTFDDVVRTARDDHRPHFAPQDLTAKQQKARYADTGFQLLIRTLELATNRTFAQLLDERIVTPLGLEHTWLPGRSAPRTATTAPSTLYAKDRPLTVPRLITSSNDLISATADLLRFQHALLGGEPFEKDTTVALLTERSNLLRNAFPLRYGLGTMTLRVGRLSAPDHRPVTLVGHSGVTGTWLFHCPELEVHLTGTIDQGKGQRAPFALMVRMLRAW